MLDEHAQHEDTFIGPMLQALEPKLASEIESQHTELDAMLDSVEAAFSGMERAAHGDALAAVNACYLTLASFLGAYVSHMSQEEDVVMPILQEAKTDEELLEISANLRGAIAPPRMAEFLTIMLPAMNLQERTQMLGGMKQFAPPEAFAGVCGLAESLLAAEDWSALRSNVGL